MTGPASSPAPAGRDAPPPGERAIWHDVECGAYRRDLPLWHELAAAAGGPVLEVGAGTGRVSIDLAARGHAVTALDIDAELLAVLRERAAGLPLRAVAGDARTLDLGERFALCIVPMQTIQLLGGAAGRARFIARAREHLLPGAPLAAAIADPVDDYEGDLGGPITPDVLVRDGVRYASVPIRVGHDRGATIIERARVSSGADGRRRTHADSVTLDALTPAGLQDELRAAGLRAQPARTIPATDEHVGSTVVIADA